MEFTGERVVPEFMACDPLTYQEHLTRYVWALSYCANKSVLDAAMGTGYGLDILSGVAKDITGLDISREAIAYASAHYGYNGMLKNFWCVDFEKEHFSKVPWVENVDVITSFETIEHLADPSFFLYNVERALRPGGRFLFSIPNRSFMPFHKKTYSQNDAQKLIAKHFDQVAWYGQKYLTIGYDLENADFFLGVATKPLTSKVCLKQALSFPFVATQKSPAVA